MSVEELGMQSGLMLSPSCPNVGPMYLMRKAERLARVKAMATNGEARAIREHARLSLRDVGLAVGVDGSTVGKWERGQRVPQGDASWRYAELIARLERAQ